MKKGVWVGGGGGCSAPGRLYRVRVSKFKVRIVISLLYISLIPDACGGFLSPYPWLARVNWSYRVTVSADLSQDFIGLKKHLVILINIVNFFSFQLVIQVMFTLVC